MSCTVLAVVLPARQAQSACPNVNSKVNASVVGSQIGSESGKAHDINIASANHIDFTNNSGSDAGGAAGVGVGVAVNTIDSQVNTSVGKFRLVCGK